MEYKQIAKKIKSAGLQKLKFYCEMCQKQCRDENGFKNHERSENHKRQMMLFIENAQSILDEKSAAFETAYMDVLRRHGRIRHNANQLYQEIVAERDHIRLNSTKWADFSDFIQYLGQTGKAEVDFQDGIGWYIKYVAKDAATLEREKKVEEHHKMIELDSKQNKIFLEQQLKAVHEAEKSSSDYQRRLQAVVPTALQRTCDDVAKDIKMEKVQVLLKEKRSAMEMEGTKPQSRFQSAYDDDDDETEVRKNDVDDSKINTKVSTNANTNENKHTNALLSTISNINNSNKNAKSVTNASTSTSLSPPIHASTSTPAPTHVSTSSVWVRPELVVRVLNSKLQDGKYYLRKGEVVQIYAPEIKKPITTPNDTSLPILSKPTLIQVTKENEKENLHRTRVVEVKIYCSNNITEVVRLPLHDIQPILPQVDQEVAITQGPYSFHTFEITLGRLYRDVRDECDYCQNKNKKNQPDGVMVHNIDDMTQCQCLVKVELRDKRFGEKRKDIVTCRKMDVCRTIYS